MAKKNTPIDDITIAKRIDVLDEYMDDLGFDIHDVDTDRDTGETMLTYAMSQPASPYTSIHVHAPLEKFSLQNKEFEEWMKSFKQHMADAGFGA